MEATHAPHDARRRVALITYARSDDALHASMMQWIIAGLARRGHQEDANIVLRRYLAERDLTGLRRHAAAIARWRPDVVLSLMTHADLAVLEATRGLGTPIVCWSMDPLDAGLVQSLAHPGGQLTGVSFPPGLQDEFARSVRLFRPDARRIGYLHNPTYAPAAGALRKLTTAAAHSGLQLEVSEVLERDAIEPAIGSLAAKDIDALVVGPHELFNLNGAAIGTIALSQGLPVVSQQLSVVEGGGLISFTPDFERIWDRAAGMADRILRGESPADMPIDQQIAPLLTLNLRSAAALGIQIPPGVAASAHRLLS